MSYLLKEDVMYLLDKATDISTLAMEIASLPEEFPDGLEKRGVGHWRITQDGPECDVCRHVNDKLSPFCPECGSEMTACVPVEVRVPVEGYGANAVIVEAPFSSFRNQRFVIVDIDSGEILDDANGYGYKSTYKAEAGWRYKHSPSFLNKDSKAS